MTGIAINTLAFHGYPLDTALEEIAQLPVRWSRSHLEYDPPQEEPSADQRSKAAAAVGGLRLKVTSVGSHAGQADSVEVFRRRIDSAGHRRRGDSHERDRSP
jgi:hypothetical protein